MGRGALIFDDHSLRRQLLPLPIDWDIAEGLRLAAVLVPIFRRDGEDWVLFTERRKDLPEHAGQIAFPGGRRDGTEDPVACALRETCEEIGQPPEHVEVLGGLDHRVSSSAYRVHAIVGRIPNPVALRPDPREVEAILEVPLRSLADESGWEMREVVTPKRRYRPTPHFPFAGRTIWGLTGRFTTDLLELVR